MIKHERRRRKGGEEAAAEDVYMEMTTVALRDLLQTRSLRKGGTKREMVARLLKANQGAKAHASDGGARDGAASGSSVTSTSTSSSSSGSGSSSSSSSSSSGAGDDDVVWALDRLVAHLRLLPGQDASSRDIGRFLQEMTPPPPKDGAAPPGAVDPG